MNEINDMLGAVGLQTHTIVLTLAGFKASEHENDALAADYGMENEKDFGKVLFFDGDCYIQHFDKGHNSFHKEDYLWLVHLQNHEYHFTDKESAIRYLYMEHYLVEHTELF